MVRPIGKISAIQLLFLIMVYFLFSGCAAKRSVLDSQMFDGAPVPSTFFVGADISTNIKYASLKSPDSEVFQGAALMGPGVGAEISIGWPALFTGVGVDYSKLIQLKSASDLDENNASGTLLNIYSDIGFYLKKWRFNFKYIISSTYTFSQKTIGAKEFELSAPESSFGINVNYGAFSFEMNSLKYGEYTLADSNNTFKSSMMPTILTYGVVYAIRF